MIAFKSDWLSISSVLERAFLIPEDAAPRRLHGTAGSRNALQSKESKASRMELRESNLSIYWDTYFFVPRVSPSFCSIHGE